jgi:hypothetical protein
MTHMLMSLAGGKLVVALEVGCWQHIRASTLAHSLSVPSRAATIWTQLQPLRLLWREYCWAKGYQSCLPCKRP